MHRSTRATAIGTAMATTAVLVAIGTSGPAMAAPTCEGRTATLVSAPDVPTFGTEGDDVIVGTDGRDDIHARGGNDVVCAGGGPDLVSGGNGNDRLLGEADGLLQVDRDGGRQWFGDRLIPGPGDDFIDAGKDPGSSAVGLAGDVITYAESASGVVGDLSSPSGLGTVTGEGSDTVVVPATGIGLEGSPRDDRIIGSPGADWLSVGDGADQVDGGAGDDLIALDAVQSDDSTSSDTGVGGAGDDLIASDAGRDLLVGRSGDDRLLPSGAGAARLSGGSGDDRIWIWSDLARIGRGAVAPDGGSGRDRIYLAPQASTGSSSRAAVDIPTGRISLGGRDVMEFASLEEFFLGGPHRWRFTGSRRAERVAMAHGSGPLRASLGSGRDRVTGSVRGDRIDAGPGRDVVRGGPGPDTCLRAEVVRCEVVRR